LAFFFAQSAITVMAALVAAIHFPEDCGLSSWVAGTSPAMTNMF
jgi:hypothetical protein